MKIKVKTKFRGRISGSTGLVVDVRTNSKGIREIVVDWDNCRNKRTVYSVSDVDFNIRRGLLEVLR